MIKLELPLIVEGKYDKITLENVVDGLIITTNGFSLFKDKEKCALIKSVAKKCGGVIVMTDSDNAGNMIRAHLKNIIGKEVKIINVYVPSIKGKEKRKTKESREGFLGVEGMEKQVIIESLEKSGAVCPSLTEDSKRITKTDMFVYGLSGCASAAENRKKLLEHLCLPKNLSSNAMLDILNTYFSYEEFEEMIKRWQNAEIKN